MKKTAIGISLVLLTFGLCTLAFGGEHAEGGNKGYLFGKKHHSKKPVIIKKTIIKKIERTEIVNNYTTEEHQHNTTNVFNEVVEPDVKNAYGAKLDFPNLIQLTENSSLGIEGSKDLYQTDSREGWAGYLKFTSKFSFVDLRKR